MSNFADPNSTASFTFESANGGVRLRIRAKFLTERDSIKLDELWQTARELLIAGDPKWLEIRDQMLQVGIVSPSLEELKDKLSRADLESLAILYPGQVNDIEAELGKSRSRPQFIRDTSAADAVSSSAITPPAAPVTSPVQ